MKSTHKSQILDSVEKLLHYLFVFTRHDMNVQVIYQDETLGAFDYVSPCSVKISPTLYTRIDNCHGAGNCCRVPFDLVYTEYDRQRILNYKPSDWHHLGTVSLERFESYREDLLMSLQPIYLNIQYTGCRVYMIKIYIRIHRHVQPLSGRLSCHYLFVGEDRYFCGIHPFKPMHCWFPHMVVRCNNSIGERPSVIIGRMQYGRNHKFGCPVKFIERPEIYLQSQFQDDYEKLRWISRSLSLMGFTAGHNFGIGIHDAFIEVGRMIGSLIEQRNYPSITLWDNNQGGLANGIS